MKKIIILLTLLGAMSSTYANTKELTVYKDANCGCCEGWVTYMRNAGYSVKSINSENMQTVKVKYNVPETLQSCHTSIVNSTGQVIEGHVPIAAVEKLIKNPQVKGVAVPGMKGNSPGMGNMNGQLVTVDFNNKTFSKD